VQPSQSQWDVVVIGGGPAGSTAAALLAKQVFQVLLAERSEYPRFHIGESLLPATWATWYKLGVDQAIANSGQVVKLGARFSLFERRTFKFGLAYDAPEYFPDNRDKLYVYQVVRSEYDQILLDNARRRGVEVHQPASVEQVIFDGSQATGVVLKTTDGGTYPLTSKVVVDASGRDSLIARKLDLRHPDPKLNKIAYFAHFKGCYREHPTDVPFWAFAFKGGWIWYITLKDDITSIGVVVDTDYAKTRAGRDLWEFFWEALHRVPSLQDWIKNAQPVGELHVISSLSFYADRFVGDGWAMIGDSAMFVDPIFSSGVNLGMRAGDLVSQAIARAFATNDYSAPVLGEYETRIRAPMRVIFPMIYRWYEMLGDPDNAIDLFAEAAKHSNLQRRMNATLGGAYEAVGEKFALQPRMSTAADTVPSMTPGS
jgi:halogenation protein CepH